MNCQVNQIQEEQKECLNKMNSEVVALRENVTALEHLQTQQCEKMTNVESRLECLNDIAQNMAIK